MVAPRNRWQLALASAALAYAAADTYVVVVVLQSMMSSVGLATEDLQKAAPIVSGFLLGYVAMLPLIGRIADLRGRIPVLRWGLFLFALGSIVTAVAYSLSWLIAGRFLQGIGGGALVPATLALVADLYPPDKRAVPLGVVAAVQEAGSVLGPVLGAAILAVASWRGIFWVNVAVAGALGLALSLTGAGGRRRIDWVTLALGSLLAAGAWLVLFPPASLKADLTWGELYVPHGSSLRWSTDVGYATIAVAIPLLAWSLLGRHPAVDLRGWARATRDVDLVGAAIAAIALGGVVIAFASADPKIQVVSSKGVVWLVISACAAVAFVVRGRLAGSPLVPRGMLRATPAWGGLAVNVLIGVALVVALAMIPTFAQVEAGYTPTAAAFVLVRLLIALPIGAVIGGHLTHRTSPRIVACLGMTGAAVGFWFMSHWQSDALDHASATAALLVAGFGFGLALSPINTAVLGATDPDVHGLASALTVVTRMVGMLVGISLLTTLVLHGLLGQSVRTVSQAGETLLTQEQAMFRGAFWVSVAAAAAAAAVLGRVPTPAVVESASV